MNNSVDGQPAEVVRNGRIDGRLIKINNQRAGDKRKSGGEVGPEGSITKLMAAEFNQRLQKVAIDLEGAAGAAWEGKPLGLEGALGFLSDVADSSRDIARGFLRAQANTIEGGTSNVMRNILGERVLGLPKEPSDERTTPWSELARNG